MTYMESTEGLFVPRESFQTSFLMLSISRMGDGDCRDAVKVGGVVVNLDKKLAITTR